MTVSGTGNDDLALRRRRALYRAGRRGSQEMDFMLGRFAEARIAAMSADDLGLFERLLVLPDPDIQHWIVAPANGATDAGEFTPLIAALRRFHGVEGRGDVEREA